MQRTIPAVLLVAGLAIGGWTLLDRTGDDVGSVTVGGDGADPLDNGAAPAVTSSPSATPEPTPDSSPPPSQPSVADQTARSAPAIGRSSGRIGDVDLSTPPAPTSIALPSIGIDAPIVPVGIDPDGLMTVPEDVDTIGWYRWGSAPSSDAGTIVLAGHVDDREQGRGAFFDLRAMAVGDEFTVSDADGATTTWRVTGRRTFEKTSLPVEDLFRRDGRRRMVLITCGGEFDRAARSYESNVVVEAEPAP